jgi:hypothetical protein
MTTIAAASTSDSAYPRNDIRSMFNTGSATPTPIVAVAPIKTNGKEKEKETKPTPQQSLLGKKLKRSKRKQRLTIYVTHTVKL